MSIKRNQPCPCGSDKKYKNCCGAIRPENQPEENLSVAALYSRGQACQSRGELAPARAYYRKVLAANPDHLEANIHLGLVLKESKDLAAAASCLRKALALDPQGDFELMTRFNLGLVLSEQGFFAEAETLLAQTIATKPDFAEGHCALGLVYQKQGLFAKAAGRFRKALDLQYNFPEAQKGLAIMSWISGDDETCRNSLHDITSPSGLQTPYDREYILPFGLFLERLLIFKESNPELFVENEELPVLYAVGDSHCLALANTRAVFRGVDHRILSRIIVGCKAWHLGNNQPNAYQKTMEDIAASIPAGSFTIFLFGEIDCRLKEGLIKHHRETNNDLPAAIITLAENYVAAIAETMHKNKLAAAISNVPAPFFYKQRVRFAGNEIIIDVIRQFNTALGAAATKRNIPVLDIYSPSANGAGMAHGAAHIDSFHLKPDVMTAAITALNRKK